MPRGGARPGAGRPRKKPADPAAEKLRQSLPVTDSEGFKPEDAGQWPFGREKPELPEDLSDMSPLDYMLRVMRDPKMPVDLRMRAAQNALPFCHPKKGEASAKKEEEAARKKAGQTGRYARRQPPALTALQGGKT